MQSIELGVCPWNKRSRIAKTRRGYHVHGVYHLIKIVLVVRDLLAQLTHRLHDMLLLGPEASGKGGANPKIWECFFRREVLKGVPFI